MLLYVIVAITVFMLLTGRVRFSIGVGSVQDAPTPGETSTNPQEVSFGLKTTGATPQPEAAYFGGGSYTPAIGPDPDSEEVYLSQ